MINVELYFGGELATFDNEDEIAATYAINKLGEVQSRQGYFTNTYRLPFSPINKRIFRNAELPQNASTLPYTLIDHVVIVEGIEVFRGVAKIEKAHTHYEVTGFAGNSDFFTRIKDLSIRDLDMSEYNHIRNNSNIEDGFTREEGYIYAYLDYGKYTSVTNPIVSATDLYPSVYFHSLIEKIVSESGYRMEGPVLSHPRYRKMVLPWHGSSSDRDLSSYIFRGHRDQLNLPANENWVMGVVSEDEDPRHAYNLLGFFKAQQDEELTINITHTFFTDRGARFKLVKRSYTNPSDSPDPQAGDVVLANGAGSDGAQGTFKVKVSMVEDDRIFLAYQNLGTFAGVAVRVDSFAIDVTKLNDTFGAEWDISDNLPDIKQDKLFLEFLVQFCLLPFTDVETNTVKLVFFDDIKKRPRVDWSNKIDDREPPQITYRFEEYAQNNTLKYKNDEPDTRDSEAGITDAFEKVFEIADQALELEIEVYESQFYLPDMGTSLGGQINTIQPKIYVPLNRGEDNQITFMGIFDDATAYNELDAVLFEGKHYKANDNIAPGGADPDENATWELVNEDDIWAISERITIGVIEISPDYEVLLGSDIEFANRIVTNTGMKWPEIYDEHYNLFNDVIDRTKIVRHLMKLNYADINQLDHTRPVYIDRYGCEFYVDLVEQFKFNQTDSTYVDLIRI